MNQFNKEYLEFKKQSFQKALTRFEFKPLDKLSKETICNFTMVVTFSHVCPKEILSDMFELHRSFYKKLFEKAQQQAKSYLGPLMREELVWKSESTTIDDSQICADKAMAYVHAALVGIRAYRRYMNKGLPVTLDRKDIHGCIGDKQLSIFTQFNLNTPDGRSFYIEPIIALVETTYKEDHPEKFAPVKVLEMILPEHSDDEKSNDILKGNTNDQPNERN